MTTTHERLKREAFAAVNALNSDRSVLISETADSLGELREHIDMLIEALSHSKETGDE